MQADALVATIVDLFRIVGRTLVSMAGADVAEDDDVVPLLGEVERLASSAVPGASEARVIFDEVEPLVRSPAPGECPSVPSPILLDHQHADALAGDRQIRLDLVVQLGHLVSAAGRPAPS